MLKEERTAIEERCASYEWMPNGWGLKEMAAIIIRLLREIDILNGKKVN